MSHNLRDDARQIDIISQDGHCYISWPAVELLFPIDEAELNRMDILHQFFLVARKNALYRPHLVPDRPVRIMDLGTGTGIWSIQVADNLHHSTGHDALIQAVDIHQFQPRLLPPGMKTIQFDIEDSSWGPLMTDCDLVHMRMLLGSVHHELWPRIYSNILDHLLPGVGFLEHVEIDWVPRWEGSAFPQPSALQEWSERLLDALKRCGRDATIDSTTIKKTINDAGFIEVSEKIIRCYINPWMDDRHEKEVARWFNIAFHKGVKPMSLMPMIKGLRVKPIEIQELCSRVKEEICLLPNHAFVNIHIWSARRPFDKLF